MRKKIVTHCIFLFTIMPFFSFVAPIAHPRAASAVIAGTSAFVPNQQAGWSVYMSYLSQDESNSVDLEFVIRHDNDIDWTEEHLVGAVVKNEFKPSSSQQITYQLLIDSFWSVRIEPSGQVFLKLTKGAVPADDPVIFPVKVKFKKV